MFLILWFVIEFRIHIEIQPNGLLTFTHVTRDPGCSFFPIYATKCEGSYEKDLSPVWLRISHPLVEYNFEYLLFTSSIKNHGITNRYQLFYMQLSWMRALITLNTQFKGTRWRNRLGRQVLEPGVLGSIPTEDDPNMQQT